ncbi:MULTISPECIES: DNA polymerase III subunit delta' [unclassified Thioalkalivibrio]|uniref:DNA polymerase III subunit delta' n=1 Tax=unclassified Thioalkalivibrio TaxID=2621013 RepID=UPI0003AB4739|nr:MULTISPECIES: DNA polymerase III subunit delta' [unclassified Thioalkalivibrio]
MASQNHASGRLMPTHPPWLDPLRQRLVRRGRDGRLPSGILISGSPGVGKGLLTTTVVQSLLCQRASGDEPGCGDCNACRSLEGGVHPEVRLLEPVEPGKDILVDAVRDATEFLTLSGSAGGLRALVIRPADSLNLNAANALLKTLEEPPAGASLFLEAARPASLPATIRSRCQQLDIASPTINEVHDWLAAETDQPERVTEAYAASLNRPLLAREILTDAAALEAWETDRQILTSLLEASDLHSSAAALQRSVPERLFPRLQALLLSAQRLLLVGQLDAFGEQFPRAQLLDFARARGARRLAWLAQQSLEWQRQNSANLSPALRSEAIALALGRR